MGIFNVPLEITGYANGLFHRVEAIVDTGSSYTFIPRDLLRQLGVSPIDTRSFVLADDSMVQYEVGQARVRLEDRELTTLVVFGPEGALPLLGATTLQVFSLGVEPVN